MIYPDERRSSVEAYLTRLARQSGKQVATHLYGQEINAETYAIAKADLTEFVRSLPSGLSTVAGERGLSLSAGQRQRVALARAFLRAPEILVLDEATSSLDILSEDRVRRAIAEMMEGKTTLIVTHRIHAVRDADLIVVLSDGKVSHLGTHEELMQQRGSYKSFLRVCEDGARDPGRNVRA